MLKLYVNFAYFLPLPLQTNFYVIKNAHQQPAFFRHDIWCMLEGGWIDRIANEQFTEIVSIN